MFRSFCLIPKEPKNQDLFLFLIPVKKNGLAAQPEEQGLFVAVQGPCSGPLAQACRTPIF